MREVLVAWLAVVMAGSPVPKDLPNVPPPNPSCPATVSAQQDIAHPSLGTVRLFLLLDAKPGPQQGCVAAVAADGTALPAIPIDSDTSSALNFANPVTDSTGNAFVTYNPGRYDGVLVLVPTPNGFEDIGWDDQRWHTDYSGRRAYYYAKLEGPGPDGSYTIRKFSNDCTPSCAAGAHTSQVLHWDGHDYVA